MAHSLEFKAEGSKLKAQSLKVGQTLMIRHAFHACPYAGAMHNPHSEIRNHKFSQIRFIFSLLILR